MITNRDIIVFSDDWGRHPFSCQHIMSHFVPHNRILWVQTIGLRRPRLNLNDFKRSLQKLRSFFRKPDRLSAVLPDNLTILNPLMLPFGNVVVREINRYSVIRSVKQVMKVLNFSNPIVVTTLPNAADYLGAFGEKQSIYYCVDEFSEWPGVNAKLVINMERKLLGSVDRVIAVSEALCKSKKPANGSEVVLLTHGVDAEHFGQAAVKTQNEKISAAFSGIPGPIIGYFGLFDERSDQDILEQILKNRPDWSVVIIGKMATGYDRLSRYSNFYCLGAVHYDELPEYVSYFSVCILPYVRSVLTDNINPLKLKEYLATGKPVISASIPEAMKLVPWVQIVKNSDDFIFKIEKAISGLPNNLTDIRNFLQNESWKTKAQIFSDIIYESNKQKSYA